MPAPAALFKHVEAQEAFWISKLADAVKIASVSGEAARRSECFRMADWTMAEMTRLGIKFETRNPGKQTLEGQVLDLPPIILGKYPPERDASKKTVLVYGHLDVQPAELEDGWATPPFVLTEKGSKLYGRGSTDDKGPALAWLWAIESHQATKTLFPVNLVICFEGMEESGSEGLDDIIWAESKPGKWFEGVDVVCISDNYWLGTDTPCVTYGLRGISYFDVCVKGPGRDLHSGVFGGTVHEPMTDLFNLMSRLVDSRGKILIPGINEAVAPVTKEELELYKRITFGLEDIHNAVESKNTIHDNPIDALMARWRFPSLSLHGIEGAFSSPGSKTVIPAKVHGKFSIRTVPNMEPDKVTAAVKAYLDGEWKKLGSKNTLEVTCGHAGKAWVTDINHYNYQSAIAATEKVWGKKPDLTREGGSIPVTLTFQEALGKSVLLLPMGKADDGAHSINEKLDKENYLKGIKLLVTYLWEISTH